MHTKPTEQFLFQYILWPMCV